MPSVDQQKRKQRVAESDEESDGSDAGGRNDAVLAKVDPEFLNKPIDLKQGDQKLKHIVLNLKAAQKELSQVNEALYDVACETAEQLSEAHQAEEYNEDKMLKVFTTEVRFYFSFFLVLFLFFRLSLPRMMLLPLRLTLVPQPSLSGLDREFRATLDRIEELEIRLTVISEMRLRITQGHQMVRPTLPSLFTSFHEMQLEIPPFRY
jgi:Fe2+ transport system protein B